MLLVSGLGVSTADRHRNTGTVCSTVWSCDNRSWYTAGS